MAGLLRVVAETHKQTDTQTTKYYKPRLACEPRVNYNTAFGTAE